MARVVARRAPPPSLRVRAVGAAGALASTAGAGAGAAAAGALAPGGRLTGFLTSTVTARVRPWLNFWRTCVASLPPFAAAPCASSSKA